MKWKDTAAYNMFKDKKQRRKEELLTLRAKVNLYEKGMDDTIKNWHGCQIKIMKIENTELKADVVKLDKKLAVSEAKIELMQKPISAETILNRLTEILKAIK